jgi:5-methylcytosine-specific restriction endonuclease McrA
MVFVLDKHKKPLMPCSEKRARLLLERHRARVHKIVPFTIRLVDKNVEDCVLPPVKLKINPGSKTTGIALVREDSPGNQTVLYLANLQHRGHAIRDALTQRKNFRKHRRNANLRYREARYNNRRKPKGWLPPSLRHRVEGTVNIVRKFQKLAPIQFFSHQLHRFDTQKLENPEISGVEYQQGELFGYEVREYLLEKWGRKCAYCGKEDVPLQIEHIVPKSKGGSDRVSNLTLACDPCNQAKGNQSASEFLKKSPNVLSKILAQVKKPLRDAAAVNCTRWALFDTLKGFGLPLEIGTGGRTKWNRVRFGIPKDHCLDAACVGTVDSISGWGRPTLIIKSIGRGAYKRTRLDKYGFPRGYLMKSKTAFGFKTGDLVKAVVPKGKYQGVHTGKVAVRMAGSFDILTTYGKIRASYRYCMKLQRGDGYHYFTQPSNTNLEDVLPQRKE